MDSRTGLHWVAGSATPERVWLTRVWNLGTWEEWKQAQRERPEQMREVVERPLRGQWTRHGKAFAQAITGVTMPEDVIISYES